MNCPFCATGQEGLTRNMSTAEIVDQVVAANRMLKDAGPVAAGDGAELGAEAGEGEELSVDEEGAPLMRTRTRRELGPEFDDTPDNFGRVAAATAIRSPSRSWPASHRRWPPRAGRSRR